MVPLLRIVSLAVLGLATSTTAPAQERQGESPNRWRVQANLSLQTIDSSETSWLAGGLGKLRRDETDTPLSFDRLLLDYRGTLTPTLFAQLDVDYTHDGAADFDLTEAYLEWRPVPRSPMRHRFRFGGFYPRLSLENVDPGWETPFSISSSAINTWIAEEVKLLGAEWSMERRLGGPGSPHAIGAFAAGFIDNDPAGTLLAWKGWGIHDRQTRWHEQLPLAPLPQLQPGAPVRQKQAPHAEPFIETDHAAGFMAGIEWRYAQRVSVQLARYDNNADPESVAGGQYGWRTRFDQAALQVALPWDIGLMAQWMSGYTGMGAVMSWGTRAVDTEFEAAFLMLTRVHEGHRFTIRFDDFEVDDLDELPLDENRESGHGLTLAYSRELSSDLRLFVEWLRVESDRAARTYLGLAPDATETVLQVQLRWGYTSRSN